MTNQTEPEDTCRPIEVDGETIRVRGSGELTEQGQEALAALVRAAKAKMAADAPEQVGVLQNRIRLAHQARRAKEHQLDDIRRALCDIGFMQDDDPYSHADLADVIRQNGQTATQATRPDARGYCPACGRGDAAPTADEYEQQRQRAQQLAATLGDVLRHFVHKSHPGEPCLSSGWISEKTVARWRDVAYPTKEQAVPGAAAFQSCQHCMHPTDWHDQHEGCVGPNGIGGIGSGDCTCTRSPEASLRPAVDIPCQPDHNGPSIREAAANDRHWDLEKTGE